MKRSSFIFLFLCFILLLVPACTWNPTIVKQAKYLPGNTLEKSDFEVGIQSYLYMPAVLSLGYGFTDNLEIKTNAGVSGNTGNFNVDLNYQLFEKNIFLLTGNISEGFFFEKEHDFFAVNSAIGIIAGIKAGKFLTLYAPLSVDYLAGGSWGSGIGLNAGIGLNIAFRKLRLAGEFNSTIPNNFNQIDVLPYLGVGLFYRF